MTEEEKFIQKVKESILLQGGTEEDFRFITKEMVNNCIRRNGTPEDLAWAIIQ